MEEKSGSSYDGGDEKTNDQKVDQEIVLPGFRFHPTDEELVGFYLKRKIQQRPFSIELIKQLDIYKFDPWDLPKFASSTAGEKEWYFYCPRDRKYRNSARPNRVTGAGFWKATGTDRPIYSSSSSSTEAGTSSSRSKCIIGLKKSLVFYKGRAARGIKTDWMMHEFRLPSRNDMLHHTNRSADDTTTHHPPTAADSWAICRIFKKTSTSTHRAIPHSWVSPSSPLLNRTTGAAGGGGGAHDHFNNSAHDEINTASPPSNTTSASMQNNMMINNEMTSLPLSQYLPTNLLDFPAPYYKPIYPLVNNKQVSSYEVYQPISSMPTSYSLPPLEVVPEPTKCNMPFFNLSSSSSVLGDFGKLSGGTVLDVAGQNRRCDSDGGRDDNHHYNFSVSLPSSEAQKHAEEEDLQMSFLSNLQQEQVEMNNINMDDQYWGALQSIDQSPTGPLSMPEVAMKLPSLWECLSNYPPPSHDLATLASLFCSELAS